MRISDWSSDVCSSYLLKFCEHGPRLSEILRDVERRAVEIGRVGQILAADRNAIFPVLEFDADIGAQERVGPLRRRGNIRRVCRRSEEHTSEVQSLMRNSYAVFCLKKKKQTKPN